MNGKLVKFMTQSEQPTYWGIKHEPKLLNLLTLKNGDIIQLLYQPQDYCWCSQQYTAETPTITKLFHVI